LDLADEIGRSEGLRRMSVIVAGNNTGARRLYERHDYEEVATAPCVREDWATATENWILLIKSL
jgi:ribosomal protein S18 acetylase RimI-like enzyme